MTVGHIAQTAIVKIAAGSDFWKMHEAERQPRQRRDRPHELHDRIERLVKARRKTEQEAERRADRQRQHESLGHAHERIEREPTDPLVHLAVLEERLEDVPPRFLPRPERRREIRRDRRADERPGQQDTRGAEHGEDHLRREADLHAHGHAIEWTAKLFAYFSGSAGSKVTPSKSVSFFMSSRGVSIPISFATSRKMSGRCTRSTSPL